MLKKIAIGFVSVFLLIVIAAYAVFELKIKNNINDILQQEISKASQVKVKWQNLHFSFSKLLLLEPVLVVENLQINDFPPLKSVSIELNLLEIFKNSKEKGHLIPRINPNQLLSSRLKLYSPLFTEGKSRLYLEIKLKELDLTQGLANAFGLIDLHLAFPELPVPILAMFMEGQQFKLAKDSFLDLKTYFNGNVMKNIVGSGSIDLSGIQVPIDPTNEAMGYFFIKNHSDMYFNLDKLNKQSKNIQANQQANLNLKITKGLVTAFDKLYSKKDFLLIPYSADVYMNLVSSYLRAVAKANIKDFKVEDFLSCCGNKNLFITGSVDVNNINFSMSGITPMQQQQSFLLTGDLKIRDGELSVIKGIKQIKDTLRPFLKSGSLLDKIDASYDSIAADLKMTSQYFQTNNLILEAPYFTAQADGYIDYINANLNYKANFQTKNKELTVPLKVTGSTLKPKITPDMSHFLEKDPTALINNLIQLKKFF